MVEIAPEKDDYLTVGKPLPGLVVLVSKGDAVMVVNYVRMEDYIASVASARCRRTSTRGDRGASCTAENVRAFHHGVDALCHTTSRTARLAGIPGAIRDDERRPESGQRTSGVVMLYGRDWQFAAGVSTSALAAGHGPGGEMAGAPTSRRCAGGVRILRCIVQIQVEDEHPGRRDGKAARGGGLCHRAGQRHRGIEDVPRRLGRDRSTSRRAGATRS